MMCIYICMCIYIYIYMYTPWEFLGPFMLVGGTYPDCFWQICMLFPTSDFMAIYPEACVR